MTDTKTEDDWRHIFGNGHWAGYAALGMTMAPIEAAASRWAERLAGVDRPWLCWNVNPDWCVVQQKLVREVGWTPIVGFDPRIGPPPVIEGAICIDFNEQFRLPTMWFHFPIEFIYLFCDRLAFWHSDLLVRRPVMRKLADLFADLPDGAGAAVAPREGNLAFLHPGHRRYWELVGCNTRGASRSQFETGCGWWMDFWLHPSATPTMRAERQRYYYDSGAGIRYWHRKCRGDIRLIPERAVAEGHCTRIGNKTYAAQSPNNFKRNLKLDLSANFDLASVCRTLDLESLV